MAGEWQLGEVAIIQQGRYLPPDTMADRRSEATPVPVWGANGVIGFTDSPSYGQAVPLVTCRGNGCGLVQWTGGAAYVSNNAMAIIARTIDESDTRYLYYSLRSTDFADVTTGSAQPQITVGHLSRKKIFWTERTSERAAIAHILGTLDDKIELNRRMNETLEAMARALFKSWFVDFDPVHAKMEGRDPRLPKTLADLFPNSVEDSELGEIPSSWGTHRLGDLLSLDKGLSYKGQFLTGSGVPMVNLGCFLGRGRFDEEAIKNYSGEYQARHVVRPFDLVLANTDITQKREVLGSPAIIPPKGDITKLIFSHHVFAARFRKGQEHWKLFVYFLLLHDRFRERARGFATGTTVLALPRDALLKFEFPAAPSPLVEAFGDKAYPLLERQWKTVAESRTVAALRDTLLPKLISGELRVQDAERFIGEKMT